VQDLRSLLPHGPLRRLFEHPAGVGTLALSPDGKWIAYHGVSGAQRDLYVVPASGGVPVKLESIGGTSVHPTWSPDGKHLAFVSNRSGRDALYALPVQAGRASGPVRKILEAHAAILFPAWSPDGRTIAYQGIDDDTGDAWSIAEDGSGTPQRWTKGAGVLHVAWDGTSGALIASGTWGGSVVELRRVASPLAVPVRCQPEVIFGASDVYGDFTVSADGRRVVYVDEDHHGDVWVLEAQPGSF